MSVFNIKKNKAICVLPWVHEHRDLSGKQRACCNAGAFVNDRSIDDIRREMVQAKQPVECYRCYKEESNRESSARINQTIDWLKKFGEPDIENPFTQYIDVRNDPTCNLKCKTCGPYASTLWAKEKNISIRLPNYDLTKYDKSRLKKIYLAGGEPTYNKSYLEFLAELSKINPTCEVMINTNLKRLPNEWKKIIVSFKNLTVIISCDAIEDLGCYVRYPLKWKQFEQNVKFVSEEANFIMFNLVPSNLTVHCIDRTVEWMHQYSNNISLTVVEGEHWEHRAVPMQYRHYYTDSLKKITKFPVATWFAHKFRLNLDSLINKYESNNYDYDLHQKLKNEIQQQDRHRTTQLKDVDPLLHSWIFG